MMTAHPRRRRILAALLSFTATASTAACSRPGVLLASRPAPIRPTVTLGHLLVEPDDGYGPVDAFIGRAKHSLDMTMYELADPTAESALIADAARGVDVRVLLDHAYSGASVNGRAWRRLHAGGVHVAWSHSGQIFHQKTITIDGTASLIMTGNLTSTYFPTTRDFAVTDTGATDVEAIEATFNADFAGSVRAVTPPAPDLVWSPGGQGAIIDLLDSARVAVSIENEEMDSAPVESALERDARRGVRIAVVMTASFRWDAVFDNLESAGIRVYVYHGELPRYIHAKAIVVDAGRTDQRACIGSQNFSTASLDYDRELGVMTTDPAIVHRLAITLAADARGGVAWPSRR